MPRTFASLAGILVAGLVVGVMPAGQGTAAEVKHTGVAKRITIASDLNPKEVHANPRDTIIWTNASSTPVLISLEGFRFDKEKSVRLGPGGAVSLFFSQPGTYQFSVQQAAGPGAASAPPMTGKVVISG